MKNSHVEHQKIAARRYHRTKRGNHFENGMLIFHVYDGWQSTRLSWWDDVTFIVNDYRVALAWHHPRQAYCDAISADINRLTVDVPLYDFMGGGTPAYKKMGRSRKKIISTTYPPLADSEVRSEQYRLARQQVMQSADYQIEPSMQARWTRFSKFVSLCAPVEVRNADDLGKLVALAMRLLKREVTLQEAFPNYRYTRADWEREALQRDDADIHAHQVAL